MTFHDVVDRMGVLRSAMPGRTIPNAPAHPLRSLQSAAEPLGYDLTYALLFRQLIPDRLNHQARLVANDQHGPLRHTMPLGDQTSNDEEWDHVLEDRAHQLASRGGL